MLWKLKSFFNDFLRRFAQVMQMVKIPTFICTKFNKMHHHIVLNEIEPILNRAYLLIKLKPSDTVAYQDNKIIWTLWWQGYSQMPLLIKKCFNSLIRHSNNHEVILITKYNVRHYAKFPSYIYDKVNNNQISLTHLSDLIRFNLLNQYGGLWIDSTIFCSSNLTEKYFGKFYTTSVKTDKNHFSISNSQWTGFLIGGNKGLPLFDFMDTFFKLYWKKNNQLIDYFLIDYALYYAYCYNIGGFEVLIDNDDYQPHLFDLMPLMSDKYDKNQYQILTKDTQVFKLTYKKEIKPSKNTYYYYLLRNQLN